MKQGALIILTLLVFTTLFLPFVAYSSLPLPLISNVGEVIYPTIPPPQPPVHGNYSDLWENDYRVDSKFLEYLNGSTFDFNGFFSQLYNRFLKELETTTFGAGYTRPTLDYGSATYTAGSVVGSLRSVATYICTSESDITNALTSASSGDIIFIDAGTYVTNGLFYSSKSDIIIAGAGWDTIIQLADNINSHTLRLDSSNNIIVRDLTIDGNRINNPTVSVDTFMFRTSTNILIENVQLLHGRRIGIDLYDGSRYFIMNSVSQDCGWNAIQLTRSSFGAIIGNYAVNSRDVAISTWASNTYERTDSCAAWQRAPRLRP